LSLSLGFSNDINGAPGWQCLLPQHRTEQHSTAQHSTAGQTLRTSLRDVLVSESGTWSAGETCGCQQQQRHSRRGIRPCFDRSRHCQTCSPEEGLVLVSESGTWSAAETCGSKQQQAWLVSLLQDVPQTSRVKDSGHQNTHRAW